MKEKLNPTVCKTIKEYVDDEDKASGEYMVLAEKMPCPVAKALVDTLSTDERKHWKALRTIYSEMC